MDEPDPDKAPPGGKRKRILIDDEESRRFAREMEARRLDQMQRRQNRKGRIVKHSLSCAEVNETHPALSGQPSPLPKIPCPTVTPSKVDSQKPSIKPLHSLSHHFPSTPVGLSTKALPTPTKKRISTPRVLPAFSAKKADSDEEDTIETDALEVASEGSAARKPLKPPLLVNPFRNDLPLSTPQPAKAAKALHSLISDSPLAKMSPKRSLPQFNSPLKSLRDLAPQDHGQKKEVKGPIVSTSALPTHPPVPKRSTVSSRLPFMSAPLDTATETIGTSITSLVPKLEVSKPSVEEKDWSSPRKARPGGGYKRYVLCNARTCLHSSIHMIRDGLAFTAANILKRSQTEHTLWSHTMTRSPESPTVKLRILSISDSTSADLAARSITTICEIIPDDPSDATQGSETIGLVIFSLGLHPKSALQSQPRLRVAKAKVHHAGMSAMPSVPDQKELLLVSNPAELGHYLTVGREVWVFEPFSMIITDNDPDSPNPVRAIACSRFGVLA